VCVVLACERHVEVFHAGVAQNYIQEGLRLKSETSSLILSKLREYCIFIYHQYSDCCIGDTAKTKVAWMYYQNFDENITAKLGIIIENWPLSKFCSPSDIGSCNELKILFQAWQSGATCFRQLSDDEWEEWEEQRFQGKLRMIGEDSSDNLDGDGSLMPSTAPVPAAADSESSSCTSTMLQSEESPTTAAVPATSNTSKRGRKRKGDNPFAEVANTVTSTDRTPLTITKKARKKRSDAGVPRKSKGAVGGRVPQATVPIARPDPHVNTAKPTAPSVVASLPLTTNASTTTPAPIVGPAAPPATVLPVVAPAATTAQVPTSGLYPPSTEGFTVDALGAPEGVPVAGSSTLPFNFPAFNFDNINFDELDATLLDNAPQLDFSLSWGGGITNPFAPGPSSGAF
jgi:hypothetical protein